MTNGNIQYMVCAGDMCILRFKNKWPAACAIQKEIHFREDCFGETKSLYYLKNKEGKEIDFCITSNGSPALMVEVKWKDGSLSPNFEIFRQYFPKLKMVQISKELNKEKTFPNGVEIRTAHNWLAGIALP